MQVMSQEPSGTLRILVQAVTSKNMLASRPHTTGKDRVIYSGCSMGARTTSENQKLNVPAPGAYELPGKVIESPGKSIGARLNIGSKEGLLGPGPGAYAVDKLKDHNVKYS